jgi:protease IV
MKVNVAGTLAFIGGLTVVFLFAAGGILAYYRITTRQVPPKTVLEADFEKNFVECMPEDRLGRLVMRDAPLVRDVVQSLARASEDPRVDGIIARVGASRMKPATIQEIRDAIIRFREKGKNAIAYAETFGEFGPGNGAYYLATAFERIYLQPSGDIGLTGLSTKTPFLRGLLEKIGVEPRLGHRKEYKSSAYTFTQKEYTGPHREADQAVLDSMISQVVKGIAESRGFTAEQVVSLIDRGPFSAAQALEEKLVDGLAYRDEVYEKAVKGGADGQRFLDLGEYLRRAGSLYSGKKKIALIYGVGQIVRGKSRYTPLGRHIMGSESVASAFRAAVKDKSVKAIIFRINSPGGSYVASDTIWRETVRAKKAGKPVIVSMSDVAGSGGYFVAMAADKIIAHPGTITGSIGVIAGKMVVSELWNKAGVNWGRLTTNRNADLWSDTGDYSPEQWERIQAWLDEVYEDFVQRVSKGRDLDLESVRRIAKGRIWSGEAAKALGLVDLLGGFEESLQAAKAAAGIQEKEMVGLKVFPRSQPLWKRALGLRPESSQDRFAVELEMPDWVEPLATALHEAGFMQPAGILQMREPLIE